MFLYTHVQVGGFVAGSSQRIERVGHVVTYPDSSLSTTGARKVSRTHNEQHVFYTMPQKISQSEYIKGVVYVTVQHPTVPSCAGVSVIDYRG